ncbi:hypothetical protein SAMN04488528_10271 [Clostridium frigidicarnis]|uniref:Uncharacterized protein n=1 Tax=Clostridium frigidicarnis TaxID=84698 RepID=A0A1I0ZX14_9CLOT|nr:hypothetical protein SAMN04488528_10271 [Clostridium frigidicarnis]
MNKTEADIYVEDTLRKDDFKYDKCIKKVLEIEGKR